ncbi:hypothetical protein BG005_003607 [Podila minutissima]|nr:hypothetical protein BG005_003607 [Podila minutissima]
MNANLALNPHLDEEVFDEAEPVWSHRSWPGLLGEEGDLTLVLVDLACGPTSYALAKVPEDGEGGGRGLVGVDEGEAKGKGETEEDGEDARLSMPKERKGDRNTPVSLKSSFGVVGLTLFAPLDDEDKVGMGDETMLCPSLSCAEVPLDDVMGSNAHRSKTMSVTFFGEPIVAWARKSEMVTLYAEWTVLCGLLDFVEMNEAPGL